MSDDVDERGDLVAALSAPFEAAEVKWKPQTVKGERALAVAFIDARLVQDRLDGAVGPEGWQTEFVHVPGGGVECRLSLLLGGRWVTKADVGSQSEQPDEGDQMKAAYSDALKRAAVQWGVGRYLYRLPMQWVDFDSQKRRFAREPQLPAWALPGPKAAAPANGKAKAASPEAGARAYEASIVAKGLCVPGDLMQALADRFGPLAEAAPAEVRQFCQDYRDLCPATAAQRKELLLLASEAGEEWAGLVKAMKWHAGQQPAALTYGQYCAAKARLEPLAQELAGAKAAG